MHYLCDISRGFETVAEEVRFLLQRPLLSGNFSAKRFCSTQIGEIVIFADKGRMVLAKIIDLLLSKTGRAVAFWKFTFPQGDKSSPSCIEHNIIAVH